MQIVQICIQNMSDQSFYFDQPEVRGSMIPGAQFYNIIMYDPSPDEFKVREMTMSRGVLHQLDTMETRKAIKRSDAWPWIVAQLTGHGWQPTEEIAFKKLHILLDAVELHHRFHGTSFDQFCAPSFPGASAIHITPAHVQRWYAKLESIDLWSPMLDSGLLASHFGLGVRRKRPPP